mgnify:CR=1 FL=1
MPESNAGAPVCAAKVAVDKSAYHFDKPFDYLIPPELREKVRVGCRVLVPFGGGDRQRQGVVLGVSTETGGQNLKEITALLDESPSLTPQMLELMKYLRANTFCTWYDAVHVLLPLGAQVRVKWRYTAQPQLPEALEAFGLTEEEAALYSLALSRSKGIAGKELTRLSGLEENSRAVRRLLTLGLLQRAEEAKRRVAGETETMLRLTEQCLSREGFSADGLPTKQKAVTELLLRSGEVPLKEALYLCASTKAVVKGLEKKGIVELFEQPVRWKPKGPSAPAGEETALLTPEQQTALDALWARYEEGKACVSLLHGVTGSGKTQVYLAMIQRVLEQGKNAIVLVPEISLTPQAVSRFQKRFGGLVAVLHSGLTPKERMEAWERLREGEARIAVGTRSAVFAPLENIGLIVIDEEQESTYKSEQSPRYHARDVAKFRCWQNGAMLLLASATPSIESYYHAVHGKYQLVTLSARFAGNPLPGVRVVDMNDQPYQVQEWGISVQLAEEIGRNLEEGKQTILLLNRRGYNTIVRCSQCGAVAVCPNCSISLTYHASNRQLICHYCGFTREAISACDVCHSKYVQYSGLGTQRAEQRLQELFPQARILRMDADTTMAKFSHEKLFSAFAEKKYDIMIGTQMVAKGLDFPDVTLVGVLTADMYLYHEDYKSAERTFNLLTQVVGRSGRGEDLGRACVQTFSPNNDVIMLAAKQDYLGFYQEEIAARKMLLYPPFCDLCAVGFSGADQNKTLAAAEYFWNLLKQSLTAEFPDLPIRVMGPVESTVLKVNNQFRYKIILKCRNSKRFREMMSGLLREFGTSKAAAGIRYYADMGFDGMV